MRECWINVYDDHQMGIYCNSSEQADLIKCQIKWRIIYRIHVRMK